MRTYRTTLVAIESRVARRDGRLVVGVRDSRCDDIRLISHLVLVVGLVVHRSLAACRRSNRDCGGLVVAEHD